ncbi:MAG: aromatic amino acid transaminase [Pseudomonadales bacterium]
MLDQLEAIPADPILGLSAAYQKDPNPKKIDLGVGVYKDETGVTPIMTAVSRATERLMETETSKSYLPQAGVANFNTGMLELNLGADHPALLSGRADSVQAPGGCGALRIGAEVLNRSKAGAKVWLSDPSWPNHYPLLEGAGLELQMYPYYNAAEHTIDFDAMLQSLQQATAGDVVLLHGCCHNPCGADLSFEQWQALTELANEKGFTPFVDAAYQGLAKGLDEDAAGWRWMAANVPEILIASSCSKNFGLYRERTGALIVITRTAEQTSVVKSQAMNAARQIYSMPPSHGGALAGVILADKELRAIWETELGEMRDRINAMRAELVERLAVAGHENFAFIQDQFGMFSFLGISSEQVQALRDDYAIYMVGSTRMNVAGLTPDNIEYFANSLIAVLK